MLFCRSTLYLAQEHSGSDVVQIQALWLSSSVPGTTRTPSLPRLKLQTHPLKCTRLEIENLTEVTSKITLSL